MRFYFKDFSSNIHNHWVNSKYQFRHVETFYLTTIYGFLPELCYGYQIQPAYSIISCVVRTTSVLCVCMWSMKRKCRFAEQGGTHVRTIPSTRTTAFFFFSIFISTLIFVLAGIGATCIHVLRIFIHIVNALLDSLLRVSNKSETVSSSFSYLWHCIIMPLGRTTNVISINLSSNPIYEYAYGGGGGVFMC